MSADAISAGHRAKTGMEGIGRSCLKRAFCAAGNGAPVIWHTDSGMRK